MTAVAGKRTEIGLGSSLTVTLAKARSIATGMREAVMNGLDPRSVLAPKSDAPPETNLAPTFGDYADDILPSIVPGFKNAKHRQQWGNTLKTHAAPLRGIRVDAITTDDVLGVLRPLWADKNETASRLRGRIERILGAAKAAGLRPIDSINPAAWDDHLEHFLSRRRKDQKGHHAAIPWREMPSFMVDLRKRADTAAAALEFTILTAARTSEVIQAPWDEIDFGRKMWTIPAARMKAGVMHQVPLSDAALAALDRMKPVEKGAFVFPGMKPGKPLSNMAMAMLMRRLKRTETVHGMRSAFRDWAGSGTSYPRELAEESLAHAVGDAVEQAYRRETALEKRRPLMEDWAAFLAG